MNFEITHGELYDIDVDTLVVFTVSYSKLSNKRLIELDQVTNGSLKLLLSSKEFTGKAGQTAVLYKPEGVRAARVLLIGLGEKKKINHDSFRKAAGISSRHSAVTKVKSLGFYFDGFSSP
ncbi:MAG: M17 family peptidase N-terminal domain-containing protein, partial [candidate division Zixibacteria bacterium]